MTDKDPKPVAPTIEVQLVKQVRVMPNGLVRLITGLATQPQVLDMNPQQARDLGVQLISAAAIVGANIDAARMTCRYCGCTDAKKCDPPCTWIAPGLCSTEACAEAHDAERRKNVN